MKSTFAAVSALAAVASARQCQNLTIPIHAAARNGVFDLDVPQNNIEVANYILNQGAGGSKAFQGFN